jgi:predicted transcriptional regulator
VNFSLPIELIEKLQEYSEETMIPQSRIVEKAIKEYIERQQPDRDKMQ